MLNRPAMFWSLVAAMAIFQSSGRAAEPAAKLYFSPVPAEQSGLSHVINSDPARGALKYWWMSPPVDINGDGVLDLIEYGHHGGGGAIWLGKGQGVFVLDDGPYDRRWVFGGRDPVWWDLHGTGTVSAIGTEGQGVSGRLFVNDGKGFWQKTALQIPEPGYGYFQWADLDGDGRHRELFSSGSGTAWKVTPGPENWLASAGEAAKGTELWNCEKLVGWPAGIERGSGPGRPGYRDAYAVDLDDDNQNELVLHFRGAGFYSPDVYTWVMTRSGGDAASWKDETAGRGLPAGAGHWLYPEDIDADGDLDLVNLHSGQVHQNDGRGKFTAAAERVFDPEKRIAGRKGHPWTTDNELQWLDLDNNGFRDLVTASDHGGENGAFLNLGGGKFAEVGGVPGSRRSRKFGDLDGDQRLEMVSLVKDQMVLHKNETHHAGLSVRLVPIAAADVHLGAKLWVYQSGKLGDASALVHYRQGFMDRDAGRSHVLVPRLHVGLGSLDSADVRVRFPSGAVREAKGVRAGSEVVLREAE